MNDVGFGVEWSVGFSGQFSDGGEVNWDGGIPACLSDVCEVSRDGLVCCWHADAVGVAPIDEGILGGFVESLGGW